MNLEAAAQVGEALGGIAILVTMLFGIRQMMEWNQNRRNETSQSVATHLSTPLVQLGMSVLVNELKENFTVQNLSNLTREQKNSINAIMVGLNNHAIMTFQGYLSLDLICAFYQPYSLSMNKRIRKLVKLTTGRSGEKESIGPYDWVIWLLDRMDEQPKALVPVYELHRNWKG